MMELPVTGLGRRKRSEPWISFRPLVSLKMSKDFYCVTDFEKMSETASSCLLQRE